MTSSTPSASMPPMTTTPTSPPATALNGEDSYGLLDANYDPTPASATKQSLLKGIQ